MQSAALASSIWIVCRKRPAARAGWDAAVLGDMRTNITQQLRDFWVAGNRGPDSFGRRPVRPSKRSRSIRS